MSGKSVLVTGATGSFGNAFVRRCLDDGARRIVVFSRDELKQAEMRQRFPDPRLRWFLGDVRDADRLQWAMQDVDVVVHAAAMKRIEQCEENPAEAVATNVMGSVNVAKVAIAAGVERAVMLSTDKAPNAATLYGATKFCAERLWCASSVYAAGTATRLSAVRYGNVLGSRGSVLGLWRSQADKGQPMTVTSGDCTRFWLTLNQAVDLVLLCLQEMRGGEVIVPKAPSSPITALARAVSSVAQITETGLRLNERLHETLISSDEARLTWDCISHYCIEPPERTWGEVPAPSGAKVPADFTYRSDTNPQQYTVDQLRELVAA